MQSCSMKHVSKFCMWNVEATYLDVQRLHLLLARAHKKNITVYPKVCRARQDNAHVSTCQPARGSGLLQLASQGDQEKAQLVLSLDNKDRKNRFMTI